jgi:hypothetical protein
MTVYRRFVLAIFAAAVIAVGAAGASLAGGPQGHVVGDNEIQARIDQQIGQADANRQAIQIMLQRPEVRQIAGAAGLDLERASAAAAVLSGPTLEKLAAQAREVNAGLVGGDGTIVLSVTAILVILLIVILLVR